MKKVYTVENALTNVEYVQDLFKSLKDISSQGENSEDREEYLRSLRAEALMYEIEKIEELIYPYSTISFLTESEYHDLKKEGFFPRVYNGSYVKMFDTYIQGIFEYEANYVVYFKSI